MWIAMTICAAPDTRPRQRGKPMSAQIIAQLKALSLHGMAASFPEVTAQARHTQFNPKSFIQQLMAAESAQFTCSS